MDGIIYCATFPNGKKYIGQTVQPLKQRKAQHKSFALNFYDNFIFHKAIRKYGFDCITWEILEKDIQTIEELNQREEYWIENKHTYYRDGNGYNMSRGGDNYEHMYRFNEEEIEKIIEWYKECGNSYEIAKKYNTSPSVIINYVKRYLPDWIKYSYNGQGQKSVLTKEQIEEAFEFYKESGSLARTREKFNIAQRTLTRAFESIDENYSQYQWTFYKINKEDVPQIYEDIKLLGKARLVAEKYGVNSSTIHLLLSRFYPDYKNYINRKKK